MATALFLDLIQVVRSFSDAEGVKEISRRLSEAIPPETIATVLLHPEGMPDAIVPRFGHKN